MPIIAGVLEVIDEPLFDTLHTLAPRTRLADRAHLFVSPVGSIVMTNEGNYVKQWLDTNLVQCSQLPAPQRFAVKAMRCAFIGRKILPCSSRYYADTLLELRINQKKYWGGPAWKCADPVTMVINADTLLAMGRHARVDLVRSLRRTLDPMIWIDVQQMFSVEVTFGKSWREYADDAPERLVILLEGKKFRAVC